MKTLEERMMLHDYKVILRHYENEMQRIVYYAAQPGDNSGWINWHTNVFKRDLKRNLTYFDRGVFMGVISSTDHNRAVVELLCKYHLTDMFVELTAWLLNEINKYQEDKNDTEMEL